ncbi:FAD-dependent oxidoreductase [Raoultibacter phocaeensis]|uniref:FAD-dependent oxidoreductase n=1 Tax=Raoultibacter phocaeensis TaxID=2479841 RepID=UPI0011196C9F|nr:FAD-dependent oxidoreductase [Raoultibacter phocaeensis]
MSNNTGAPNEHRTNNKGLSRRAFLGLGAAAAVTAGAGLAGCAPSASVSTTAVDPSDSGSTGAAGIAANDTSTPEFLQIPDPIPESSLKETIEADIVIIGAGLSGLCAARAAVENGAERIVVVEKADSYQYRSNQVGTVGGQVQEALEIDVDGKAVVSQLAKECGYRPNMRLLKLWADHSGAALDWFLEPCADEYVLEAESDPYDGESLSVRKLHWPHPDTAHTENDYYPVFDTCQALLPDLGPYLKETYKICADAGVEFRFSNWARQLVRADEGRGKVESVIVVGLDDGYRRINASKAVLLATGDYSSNTEMMQYYARWASRFQSIFPNVDAKGNKTNTGDGQRMGMWIGAKMEAGPHAPMTHHLGGPLGVDGFLLVDVYGERFMNEDVGGQWLQNQLSRLPEKKAWQIFDSRWPEQIGFMDTGHGNVNWYVESGSDVPNGSYGKNAYIAHESSEDGNTPGFDTYFAEDAEGVTADSLAELAVNMGVEADALEATITRYNELAEAGSDEDFNKRADRMFPIAEPPFYAYPMTDTVLLVCMGGLVTNTNFQVLDAEDDSLIEGLYAVGNCQGGRFLVDYPLAAPGISHGMAITHGKLVGELLAGKKIGSSASTATLQNAEAEKDAEEPPVESV